MEKNCPAESELLVHRAKAGDPEAFETLVNAYHPMIFKQIGRHSSLSMTDELYVEACEGFLDAVLHWTEDGGAHFGRYAETCVVNRLRTYGRQRASLPTELPTELSAEPQHEAVLIRRDMMERVLLLVRHLASDLEFSVFSYYLRGCPPREIARSLGVGVKEVTNAKARLFSKMRKRSELFAELL